MPSTVMIRYLGICLLALVLSAFTSTLIYHVFLTKFNLDKVKLSLQTSKEQNESTNDAVLGTDVIIVGQGRSGTTFLGELFNQHPDIFYVFEPLKFQADRLNVNIFYDEETQKYQPEISSTLTSFLSCNLSSKKEILGDLMASSFRSQSKVLKENLSLDTSKTPDELSFNVSQMCHRFKHKVIKVLSGRLSKMSIETLQDVVKASLLRKRELKIIHLVRDPRAVLSSWIKYFWIKDFKDPHFERNVKRFCQTVKNNLKLGENPPEWLRNRYKSIQYETMVTEPLSTVHQVYKFIGIEMATEVEDWIKSRKKITPKKYFEGFLSTMSRNASFAINKWKKYLSPESSLLITRVCSSVIKKLN